MLGPDREHPAAHPKAKFLCFPVKNHNKLAAKHSIEKAILLNFVNLPTTSSPRLYFSGNHSSTFLKIVQWLGFFGIRSHVENYKLIVEKPD